MSMFGEMKASGVLTLGGGILSGVVLLGAALSTLPVVEPYAPSTRGYTRMVVDQAVAQEKTLYDKLSGGLNDTTVGIADLKLVAINGQIDALNNQLNEINLKLADPQGADRDLLIVLKKTITDQVTQKQKEADRAACDKQLAQFPSTTCTVNH